MEGTLESLTPNINLLIVLKNKIKEDSLKEIFSEDMAMNVGKHIVTGANSLSQLPGELLSLVRDVNRGETKIDIEVANSDKQVDKLEKMLHQLIIGGIDAALLLGGSMVQNPILKVLYLGTAGVLSLWLLTQMIIDHFHKGY